MTLNAIVEHAVSERGLVEFIRFSTSSIVYAPILDELASKSPPTVPAGDSTTATDAITKRSHWERVMEALAVQRKEIEACGLDATQLDDAKSEKDDIYALELLLSDMVAHCREALTQLGARHD